MAFPRIPIDKLPTPRFLVRDIFAFFFPGSLFMLSMIARSEAANDALKSLPLGEPAKIGYLVVASYLAGYALHIAGRFGAAIFVVIFMLMDILVRRVVLRRSGFEFSFFATSQQLVLAINKIIVLKIGGLPEPTDIYYRLRYLDFSPDFSDRLAILSEYYSTKYSGTFEGARRGSAQVLMTITLGATFCALSLVFTGYTWPMLGLGILLFSMGGAFSLQDARLTIPAIIAGYLLEEREREEQQQGQITRGESTIKQA